MNKRQTPPNVSTLSPLLERAEQKGYAVGSFSPRYTAMIEPVILAAELEQSPAIVQISQKEIDRYGTTLDAFAREFYRVVEQEAVSVPLVLHLDHTKDVEIIWRAIEAGFTSVMIDASEYPLPRNVEITRQVVERAHRHGVTVEGELGRIATSNFAETDSNEELFTDPEEAAYFVRTTGVDALAVSVGTVHGVYRVSRPQIDFALLAEIRRLTSVPLVLHGGSGVPADMIHQAISHAGGGISKVNIATDLELAFLASIGRQEHLTNEQCNQLPVEQRCRGQEAVERVVRQKMRHFLRSSGQSWPIRGQELGGEASL